MSPRFSLRAQILLVLAVALTIGLGFATVASLGLLRRAATAERREVLTSASSLLAAALKNQCAEDRACLESSVEALAETEPALRIVPSSEAERLGLAGAPLTSDTVLVLGASTPGRSTTSTGELLFAYLALNSLLVLVLAALLINRAISRPLDQLASAAERIGRLDLEDPLQGGAPTLGRLGNAFERMAHNLKDERRRVARQLEELRVLNRELAEARDSLVRTEKLATVGRLAAGVAHEVGNPLGAIVGYLDLARGRAERPELKELLGRIDHEVARIDRTVRELLDYSRPSAVSLGPLPLHEALASAVRLASVQQRLKSVEFSLDIAPGLTVLADSHHLSQVLVNVLLNAGDAMGGQGSVVLRARELEVAGPRIVLDVADSGPGIPAADLPRVFDPFFSTKEPGEGTGLGLSICQRLMESFGGELRAANAPGGGAVITLAFRAPAPGAIARPAV